MTTRRTMMVDLNTGVQLGDLVEDIVTGFQGVAVARTQWLHGCLRYTVQPQGVTKDGKIRETQTFDEPQLKILRRAIAPATPAPYTRFIDTRLTPLTQQERKTGGPRPEPTRR